MGTYVGLHNRIYLGHLDLSGLADTVNFGPITRVPVPCTTYNDGGYEVTKPGLISGEGMVSGFQDFAADVLDDELGLAALGTQYPFTVVANPTGTVTAGDPCWMSRGFVRESSPLSGAVGEMAAFSLAHRFDTAIPRGLVAHPLAARTSDADGTAVTLTGPTASQKLYAALHVTAFSGFSGVVIKVQSDNDSGMGSPTDRITFTTVAGTTSQWSSVAGSFSTETHHRVTWDVTGSGSISFVVALAVL